MAHRGPTPSLLPKVPAPDGFGLTTSDVEQVLRSTCWDRASYSCRADATEGAVWANAQPGTTLPVQPYRCPFHDLYEGNHWHVAEVLTGPQLEVVAAVIRWCAANPDQRPTPPPRS